jgi:hypothetical protein
MPPKRYALKNIPVVTEVPVPDVHHPPPNYDRLPTHEFTMGLIAPKGSGKTTTIINLMEFYADYFHSILVFSPTVASDEKWDYIKRKPLLKQNVELKAWVKSMAQKKRKRGIVEGPPIKNEFEGLVDDYDPEFDGIVPEECFYEDYDEETLRKIYTEQMTMVKLLKKYGKTKHLANRVLIIFDDMVGSILFSNARRNVFKGFNTRHRHYSCSMLMVSQGYNEIPRTVRINYTCLVIFEICNDKELEVIHYDFSMGIRKYDDWLKVYMEATKLPFNFLFYNIQPVDKNLRTMRNFEDYIFITSEEEANKTLLSFS